MILDDSFSALDGKTESSIIENLLGPEGYFKKSETTVFYIATSGNFSRVGSSANLESLADMLPASHFHLADKLIILGDGSVTYQGTWADLEHKPESMLKVDLAEPAGNGLEQRVDKTVLNQSLKVADAISDLSRATGDFSLYGK